MAQKIRAIMIIEIAGRPANHVKDSLKAHTAQIRSIKDICVENENISEPKLIEMENKNPEKPAVSQEFYSCFSEIEFTTNSFQKLTDIVFDFMPSSIEILEPSELDFNLADATTYLNTLAGRLHKYDEIAKVSQLQVQQLAQRMQMMQQLSQRDKELGEAVEVKGKKKSKKSKK
jgi:hypothetical protein